MSAFLTEVLPVKMDEWSNSLRHAVRRYYLRKRLKNSYGRHKNAITREQRKAAKEYWHRYTKHFSPLWHELFTERTGVFDVHYVPVDIHFTEIEGRLNSWASTYGIDNKNNYSMYFPEVRHPKSVFRKMAGIYHDDDYHIITKEQAIQNCLECGDVIFKVAVESGKGGGISFWRSQDGIDCLRQMIDAMPEEMNAQEYIKQHPMMAKMNPTSANTIRVVTYASSKGIRCIASYFQVGRNNDARLSQEAFGGVCVSILPNGKLCKYAVDKNYQRSTHHPCGIAYEDFEIPSYDKVTETAIKLHRKMGDFKIISWDFCVDCDGEPVFIEMNLKYGGIMFHQLSLGPLFGEATDEILDEIFEKKD